MMAVRFELLALAGLVGFAAGLLARPLTRWFLRYMMPHDGRDWREDRSPDEEL
jgi:hypothetical protein